MDHVIKEILLRYLIFLFGASLFGMLFIVFFLIQHSPFYLPLTWLIQLVVMYFFFFVSLIGLAMVIFGSYTILMEGILVEPYRRPIPVTIIGISLVITGLAFTPVGWQFFSVVNQFILTAFPIFTLFAMAWYTLSWNIWYVLTTFFYGMVQIFLGLGAIRKGIVDYYRAYQRKADLKENDISGTWDSDV
jgi:hypothetical protein